MAAAETARLIASLELQDRNFSRGVDRIVGGLGRVDSRLQKTSGLAHAFSTALGVGIERFAESGIRLLVDNVRSGVDSLQRLQDVQRGTAAVIESTGAKAGVTAQEIRDLAEAQESLTTVDDKVVQSGENLLLTFTNIGSDIFPDATKAMVNMAIAMNQGNVEGIDLKSTAIQLGKALQDPIRGATTLRRVGVALSEQQQKDIKVLVQQGKLQEAQKIILKELQVEFGKAGRAAGQGASAGMRRLQDAVEDSQIALAEGLLPAIEDIRTELTKALSNPQTQSDIRNLGRAIGDVVRGGIEFAKGIPWSAVGDALKIAGTGARAVLDAFRALPPWVQTAVITGWGLNKLSGGFLTQFAGGLIKGVLGMNAGVVNIKAAVVNGGGLGGAAGAGAGVGAAGRFGKLGTVATTIVKAVPLVLAAGTIFELKGVLDAQGRENRQSIDDLTTQTEKFAKQANLQQLKDSLAGIEAYDRKLSTELTPEAIAYQLNIDGVRDAVLHEEQVLRDAILGLEQFAAVPRHNAEERAEAPGVIQFGSLGDKIAAAIREGLRESAKRDKDVFVPTVKLDPSQVTDLRGPTTKELSALNAIVVAQHNASEREEAGITGAISEGTARSVAGMSNLDATTRARLGGVINQLGTNTSATRAAGVVARSGGIAAAAAIRAKKLSTTNNINIPITTAVTVSARDINRTVAKFNTYASRSTSGVA